MTTHLSRLLSGRALDLNIGPSKIARMLGELGWPVTPAAVGFWLAGRYRPEPERYQALAVVLGLSVLQIVDAVTLDSRGAA